MPANWQQREAGIAPGTSWYPGGGGVALYSTREIIVSQWTELKASPLWGEEAAETELPPETPTTRPPVFSEIFDMIKAQYPSVAFGMHYRCKTTGARIEHKLQVRADESSPWQDNSESANAVTFSRHFDTPDQKGSEVTGGLETGTAGETYHWAVEYNNIGAYQCRMLIREVGVTGTYGYDDPTVGESGYPSDQFGEVWVEATKWRQGG